VISETVSRKTFFGNTPSQASTSNFTRFNPHKKEKVGPILSDDMKDYIDDNFNLFLPNQKIQDLILKTYPIPEHNALSIKKIDPLVISILEGQRRSINKNVDRAFTAIQNRLFMTMGPLVHLWLTLDKINNSFEMNPNLEDSAHAQLDNIDIRQLIDLVEKTICCLGQTNVTINYQRRTYALVKVTRDPSKAKAMLRDKHDILAKSEDFCSEITSNPISRN